MANLQSPGVSVTVSADPISSAAGAGTVPLFIIATAQDKLVTGSNVIASGTTKANAGKLQLITSPKNTLETFGTPLFQTHDGSVVQGDELNEYGLHALYSYMGIANRAYVVRADIDMSQLSPMGVEPTGNVANGTLWFDAYETKVEVYVSDKVNPQNFYDWKLKTATIVSADDLDEVDTIGMAVDDVVLVYNTKINEMGVYVYTADGLVKKNVSLAPINRVPTKGGVWIRNGYTKSGSEFFGTRFAIKRFASLSASWINLPAYTGNSFYEIEAQSGTLSTGYVASIFDEDTASFKFYMSNGKAPAKSGLAVPKGEEDQSVATKDGFLTIKYLNKTAKVQVLEVGDTINADTISVALKGNAQLINDGFEIVSKKGLQLTNRNGYSFQVVQSGEESFSSTELLNLQTESNNYSVLNANRFNVKSTEPRAKASEGTLWYDFDSSDSLDVTMYVSNYDKDEWTLIEEDNRYIQFDEPMPDRDFWVQPQSQGIDGYRFFRNIGGEWFLLDDTDQSTIHGIIFENFEYGEQPSANLYMHGTLAVDLGNTEGVVKVMKNGRWEVASGVALNGAGLFGRSAQRKMIVEAMAEVIIGNDEIRSEFIDFNLMCAPGYVELLNDFVTLNVDRRETAFIITDVPARLQPNGMDVLSWATNKNNAPRNGEVGRTTGYDYAAMYMGWCLSTNVDGKEIVVPGSTVAARTYAYSDSVSYVWFPPAGTQRGVVTNATSTGYINSEGDYQPVIYNQGQRDVMYTNKINPIALRPNRGLIVYGDKTLTPNDETGPMSRVNVARLVVYIKRQLEIIAEPFLFRLNTPSTRQEFAGIVTNFLAEITQLEGLYDFIVVCDESNNTMDRISRNELWMDIAIAPTRSINFIYVPMRVQTSLKN